MDEEGVEGVADAYPAGFGVVDDATPHLKVTIEVEICVDNPGSGLDYRHLGVVAYKVNQPASTTRDADINLADRPEEGGGGFMSGGEQGCRVDGDAVEAQGLDV